MNLRRLIQSLRDRAAILLDIALLCHPLGASYERNTTTAKTLHELALILEREIEQTNEDELNADLILRKLLPQ